MTNTIKIIAIGVAGVIVGLLISATSNNGLGGVYNQVNQEFYQGLKVGTSNQFVVESDGDIVSSAAADVGRFTQGGGIVDASDTDATIALTQAQLLAGNLYEQPLTIGAATITTPATSTLTTFIPTAGDSASYLIHNATTTAGITLTVAAGTGTNLFTMGTTSVIITPNKVGRLIFTREADTDVSLELYLDE